MTESARRRIAALVVIAGLAAAAIWQREALQRIWRRTTGPVPPPVVLVLSLDAPAEDPAAASFANGVTRDIIARLGQIPGVKVLGRAGLTRVKEVLLQDALRQADAPAALRGTLARSGDDITMDLELIAARGLTSIWAGRFSGRIEDILSIEAEAAAAVADVLGVETESPSNTRALSRRVDPRAYELHARGQDALARLRPSDALDLFNQAVAADATLAESWSGIAEAVRAIDVDEGVPDDPARQARLREAAPRALELDRDAVGAHIAMGFAAPALNDSLASLARAIEIDPSNAVALEALGNAVRDLDPDRALAYYGRALLADPFRETIRINNASTLLLLNRWGLAEADLRKVVQTYAPPWGLAMFPVYDFAKDSLGDALADLMIKTPQLRDRPYSLAQLVQTLARQRKTEEALKEGAALLARFPDNCEGRAAFAGALADAGRAAEASEAAAPLLANIEGDSVRGSVLRCAVLAAAALGDAHRAAALIERIGSRDEWQRAWTFARFGQSGRLLLMGHTYPLTKVVEQPPMTALRSRIDAATEDKRVALRGLLGPIAYQ